MLRYWASVKFSHILSQRVLWYCSNNQSAFVTTGPPSSSNLKHCANKCVRFRDQLCFAKQAGIISYKSYVIRQIDFKTAFYLISTLRAGPCLSPNNIALYVEIRYWKSRVQKIVASGMNFACPVITWLLASSAKGELKRVASNHRDCGFSRSVWFI